MVVAGKARVVITELIKNFWNTCFSILDNSWAFFSVARIADARFVKRLQKGFHDKNIKRRYDSFLRCEGVYVKEICPKSQK